MYFDYSYFPFRLRRFFLWFSASLLEGRISESGSALLPRCVRPSLRALPRV
jgi:hypothetical protein